MTQFSVNVAGCLTCCGETPPPLDTLECRVRGGTATLCGYSEYSGHESTPPKKYRRKDFDGGKLTDCFYNGGPVDCSGGVANVADSNEFGGFSLYDASTCTEDVSNVTVTGKTGTSGCNTSVSGTSSAPRGGTSETLAATTRTVNGTGACYITGGGFALKTTGGYVETLSVEDVEANAITRLLAVSPWSAWGSTPMGDCGNTAWENRTSGFSFEYDEHQFRYSPSGLSNSTNYTFNVDLYRRVYGGGGWTYIGLLSTPFTTNATGYALISGDVPVTQGYEAYVDHPTIT